MKLEIEKIIKELSWDYTNGHKEIFITQNEWNNTLLTKINEAHARCFKHYNDNFKGGAPYRVVIINPKWRKLISGISYFTPCEVPGHMFVHKMQLIGSIAYYRPVFLCKNMDYDILVYEPTKKYGVSVKIDNYEIG